jgi:hypothetical protein
MSTRQGILPYRIETTDRSDTVTARAGLPLVIETMRALAVDRAIEQYLRLRQRQGGFTEVQKVEAVVLLLAAGGDCLDDIRILSADAGLCRLLDRKLPSPDTLLSFLYGFHDDALIEQAQSRRLAGTTAFIPDESAPLQALARVNTALVHALAAQGNCSRATLDHDATIQESHKRQALPHYQDGRGYQPSAIYWVEQDLVVADEYRDGNVPAGMRNLPLIQKGFASLPPTIQERFFRADSACYDERVLKWLADPQREDGPKGRIGFTISADMSDTLRALCIATPESSWQLVEERAEETVMCADVEFAPGNWPRDAAPLRYVVVRFRKRQQRLDGGSDTKYLAIVSNRSELDAANLCRWHWQKAGTIEQVHDITKNELAARVPPCGRFGANAAWYRLAMITYNVLSAMKSLALPPQLGAARPKRLRFSLFAIAGRLLSHAGMLVLRLGAEAERIVQIIEARLRLTEVFARIAPA